MNKVPETTRSTAGLIEDIRTLLAEGFDILDLTTSDIKGLTCGDIKKVLTEAGVYEEQKLAA